MAFFHISEETCCHGKQNNIMLILNIEAIGQKKVLRNKWTYLQPFFFNKDTKNIAVPPMNVAGEIGYPNSEE